MFICILFVILQQPMNIIFLVITYGPTFHVSLHQPTFVVSGLVPRGFFFVYSHAAQTMNEASCQKVADFIHFWEMSLQVVVQYLCLT